MATRKGSWLIGVVLLLPALVSAQTPCEGLVTTVVARPARLAAELPEYDVKALDGVTFKVPVYVLSTWAEGAAAPTQTTTIPREAWTLYTYGAGGSGVAPRPQLRNPADDAPSAFRAEGSLPCYTTAMPATPLGVDIRYFSTLTAKGVDGLESVPSSPSNPFGWPSPPVPVGRVRLVKSGGS